MAIESDRIAGVVEQLLRADSDSRVQEMAQELCALWVSGDTGLLPRGTLSTPAEAQLPVEVERELLNRWSLLENEPRHWLTSALSVCGGAESAVALSLEVETPPSPDAQIHAIRALGMLGGPESVTGLAVAIMIGDDEVARIADWQLKELALGGSEDASRAPAIVSETFAMDVFQVINWPRVFGLVHRCPESYYSGLCRLIDVIQSRTSTTPLEPVMINNSGLTRRVQRRAVASIEPVMISNGWPRPVAIALVRGPRPVRPQVVVAARRLAPVARLLASQHTRAASSWKDFAAQMQLRNITRTCQPATPGGPVSLTAADEIWTLTHCHLTDRRIPDCSTLARAFEDNVSTEAIAFTLQNAALDEEATYQEAIEDQKVFV